jgi:hypothetical protein
MDDALIDETAVDDLMDDSAPTALADALVVSPQAFKLRDDPALPHYPRGLVMDLCMKTAPVADLLQAYKMSVEDFKLLVEHPVFRQDMRDTKEKLRDEGFSFKVKAQAQAEAYLHEAWAMVHNPDTPANVRADLIKWTTKVGGLEPKQDAQTNVAVNVDMRQISDEELTARVMQIAMKRAPQVKGTTVDG